MAVSQSLPVCLLTTLLVVGCGRAPRPSEAELLARRPSDAALAAKYERACQHCHASNTSGAPRVGERADWGPRESAGSAQLLKHVREGLGAMPPMGWCPDCSDEELRRLIDFLRQEARR